MRAGLAMMEHRTTSLLERLSPKPSDPLLAIIGAFARDERPDKIDVGVGVYRDEHGATPVVRAIKVAEERLLRDQKTKAYLGPEGNLAFLEHLAPVAFGAAHPGERLSAVQTPGGTGALRLAAELVAAANPDARILVGDPTWPNHLPIVGAARLEIARYGYYDVASGRIRFDEMVAALQGGEAGDVVLLHASGHNPTGADLDPGQWAEIAAIVADRGTVPLIDMAYQGLGTSLDADAAGARMVVEAANESFVAYSCDKNFGLYRERTGALFVTSASPRSAQVVQANLLSLARANWSMPPDHGAAAVATVLADDDLCGDWRAELDMMSTRIRHVRGMLASACLDLDHLRGQHGLFGMLPLTPTQVDALRSLHAVYMPQSARINLAGLTAETIPAFAAALASVRGQQR